MSLPGAAVHDQQTMDAHSNVVQGPRRAANIGDIHSDLLYQNGNQSNVEGAMPKGESSTSTFTGRLRSASKKFEDSNPPKGMWDATATIASSIPSLGQIRIGSIVTEGRVADAQQLEKGERQINSNQRSSLQAGDNSSVIPGPKNQRSTIKSQSYGSGDDQARVPAVVKKKEDLKTYEALGANDLPLVPTASISTSNVPYRTTAFDNGYHFPPKHTWTESTIIFLGSFWKFTTTWLGFLVVIYGLNVVAWGGMIFLLLCNAAPTMCTPDCNDINSPRRIWIEIDAQVLTALFSVTGFGLIPWRFRDLFYLLKYRLNKDQLALRRLAGIHRDWFRLDGSQNLPTLLGPENIELENSNVFEFSIPYPLKSIPNAPLTGIRAPPTAVWKLDYVIWMFVWNTFLQAVLSGIMWGLSRYNRPPWATGLFVALACIVAACAGIMIFTEGKKVKGIEGIPVSEKDQERLKRDRELGILHFNNINDSIPKEKKRKSRTMGNGESQKANEITNREEIMGGNIVR